MGPAPYPTDTPASDLFQHLRLSTSRLHRDLETSLGLLSPPVSQERFVWALRGFAGFHRVWEGAIAERPALAAVYAGRSRLRLAETDLERLGVTPADIASLPGCEASAALLRIPEIAMGSMYVMEGSTLGGEVISRALRREKWLPTAGLGYFAPPQRDVRRDWSALRRWAIDAYPRERWPLVEQGARETFALLQNWMMAQSPHG